MIIWGQAYDQLQLRSVLKLLLELDEIKHLFTLQDSNAASQDVKAQTQAKIKEIDARITSLQEIRKQLVKLECACSGKMPINECPILEGLYESKEA